MTSWQVMVAATASMLIACGGSGASGVQLFSIEGLNFEVPSAWETRPPANQMRLAQFSVPGDAGEVEMIVYRFPGAGGSAEANVRRWISQFKQADGTDTRERARVEQSTRGELVLTELDVTGDYGGMQMPGAPPQPAIQNARLLALVVEGSGDPYFFKLQGAADDVAPWAASWTRLRDSIATP